MGIALGIILTVLILIVVAQVILFAIWIRGNLDLSNFFSKKWAWLFFVPIVGVFAFLCGAAKARITEDFGE